MAQIAIVQMILQFEFSFTRDFMNGENMAGGMLEMKPEWGDVPPNWMNGLNRSGELSIN